MVKVETSLVMYGRVERYDAKRMRSLGEVSGRNIDARNHTYLTLERGRRGLGDKGSLHEEFRGSHVKLSNV